MMMVLLILPDKALISLFQGKFSHFSNAGFLFFYSFRLLVLLEEEEVEEED